MVNKHINMMQVKERLEFEDYEKGKLLGQGAFGKAYLVKRVADGLSCVMKVIDMRGMNDAEKNEML